MDRGGARHLDRSRQLAPRSSRRRRPARAADSARVCPSLWADEVEPVYRALHAWTKLLAREHRSSSFRLSPGEMLIFDNRRMLHGRTAFEQAGPEAGRVLEGAYVDWDGVASRYRSLSGG